MPNDDLYSVELTDTPPAGKSAVYDDLYDVELTDTPPAGRSAVGFPSEPTQPEQFAPETEEREIPSIGPMTDYGAWHETKDFLRRIVSPVIGRTESQEDLDLKALFEADPKKVEHLFDEEGNFTPAGSNAWKSLGRGVDQAQGLGYGLGMLGADLVGADSLADWLHKKMKANEKQIEENPANVGSAKEIGLGYESGLKSVGPRTRRLITYGQEKLFENLPAMVPSLLGGGVSGILAKKVVARGLEKSVVNAAIKHAEKKIIAAQAAGTLTGATGVQAGSIYQEMVNQDTRGPVPALVALGAGLATGALDAITPFLAIRTAGGEVIKSPIEQLVRSTLGEAMLQKGVTRIGVKAVEGALTEGPTEFIQTAMEQAARLSQDPKVQGRFWETFWNSYELQQERIEAGIAGALVGGTISGGAGIVGRGAADRKAFELGVKHALARVGQPEEATVRTAQGARVQVPVQPSPVRGTAREIMPPVAGVEGSQAVNQALSVGLPRTAQALAVEGVTQERA
ncbi:MAG: hypothetical protein ACYST6_19230, partial [Planctomycetota bacterium]